MSGTSGSDLVNFEEQGLGSGGVPAGTVTYPGVSPPWPNPPGAPATALAALNSLITYLTTQGTEVWVDKNRVYAGGYHGAGTNFAPFDDLPVAVAWMAADGKPVYHVHIAPCATQYSATTVPAGLLFYASCGGAVQVASLTVTGTAGGGGGPIIFSDGFTVAGNLTYTDPADATAQSVVVFKEFGGVAGNVVYGGGSLGSMFLVGVGLIEPVSGVQGIAFNGTIDVGPLGYVLTHSADVQGAVSCAYYAGVDSKQKADITCAGSFVELVEAEGENPFPYGAPTITFSGPAGVVFVDGMTYRAFSLADGTVTNGAVECGGARFARLQWWQQQPYAFGAATQYFYTFSGYYSAIPAMVDAASNAVREPVNPTAVLRMFEGIIDTSVGVDEDFELEILGCVHDPSGGTLLKNETLYSLDTPVVLTYAAGSSGSQRTTDVPTKLTVNGGQPATHITVAWKQVGGNVYPGTLSVNLDVE